MGNAGRVLMIPKGDYNPATPYEMLDCVYYNGRSYVCKQASTGHAPTDIMYWQPMTPDSSAEIQALTNYVLDTGVYNLLPLNFTTKSGTSGCYITNNGDGSVTYKGDDNLNNNIGNLSAGYFSFGDGQYANNLIRLKKGTYTISGLGRNDCFLQVARRLNNETTVLVGTQNAESANFTISDNYADVYVRIRCSASVEVTFTPVLCLAEMYGKTSPAPYAKTNVELTDAKADKSDLASISITGTTNNTGATIASGTYFYLNGALVKAKTSISNGATLTANTNYEAVTAGALNDLYAKNEIVTSLEVINSDSFTIDVPETVGFGGYIFLMNYTSGLDLTDFVVPVRGNNTNIFFGSPIGSSTITIQSATKSGAKVTITLSDTTSLFGMAVMWKFS